MNRVVLALVLLVGTVGVASAGVPPALKPFIDYGQYYTYDAANKEWTFTAGSRVNCASYVAEAVEAGVADTLTVDVPWDTPDWKAGPRTFKQLKEYCARATRSDTIFKIVGWFNTAQHDDQGDIAAVCIKFYNDGLKEHGIAPTIMLPYEGISTIDPATGDPFKGTLEEGRKKFCDPRAKKYLEEKAAAEAPYRKVLKGGKLEVALSHLATAFYGPGGKELTSPARMAKAKVWFRKVRYTDRYCRDGAANLHSVTRYQFDRKHKLVKSSARDYCGEPPRSAFK